MITHAKYKELQAIMKQQGINATQACLNMGLKRFEFSNFKAQAKAKRARAEALRKAAAPKLDLDGPSPEMPPAARGVETLTPELIQATAKELADRIFDRLVSR